MSLVYSIGDLIEATYDVLLGPRRQAFSSLSATLADGATSVSLTASGNVSEGSFLGIGDELLYVQSIDQSSRVATVVRQMRATTNVTSGAEPTHAVGTMVVIDPLFPRHAVRRAIRAEVQSWPDDLFFVAGTPAGATMTPVDDDSLVYEWDAGDVPSGRVVRLLEVWVDVENTDGERVYPTWQSEFPGGQSGGDFRIRLTQPVGGADVQVIYAVRPSSTSSLWAPTEDDTDLTTLYIHEEWFDIAQLGACWRLMVGGDIRRSSIASQPAPRAAEEVPAGFAASTATFLKRQRDQRIADEIIRLKARWPLRRY